ncbi:MAG: hypothetical protein HY673_08320 [Chloroflexi bacterium]|nr:hypothetical protein [Chloroflexota bacterium]
MRKLRVVGLIIMAVLVAGAGVWAAVPALARGPVPDQASLSPTGDEAPGAPGPGPMRRMARMSVNGNVKTITLDSAGKIQTIVLTNLRGRDVTFQVNENTQYRFALGITTVSVGNFVTVFGRRQPNANPVAGMVIVNSIKSVYFITGKVTAKGADSFTVKMQDKEYVIKVDANTKYRIITPPARQARGQGRPQGRPAPTITSGTFADVKVDLRVTVRATGTLDNLLATNVNIFLPPPPPPPTPTPTPGASAKPASLRTTY